MTVVLDQPWQIAAMRDRVMLMHVRAKARGMNLTRNAPPLKAIRAEYGLKARNWADAAAELEAVLDQRDADRQAVLNA